jgi:O-antigen/teichoic acid export membrane protein
MANNQLKAGAVLNYFIIGLNAIVGFLYTPYMLHKLGQSEYGLYSLVASVVAYLTLMDFGFGNAVVRYTAKYRAEGKKEEQYNLFGMLYVLYTGISVLAALGGLALYFNVENMFGDTMTDVELSRAKVMMLILTFNLAFTFLFQIFGSIITAYEDFIFQKTFSIIRLVLNTLIMVFLLHLGYKAIAMVVVTTVFNVVTLLINYFYCKRKIKIKVRFGHFDKSLMREIAIYSFWIFLNAIMDRIYWSTGQFVLGAVSGTIAVSVFALAIHMESMYMSFSTAISGVFLPKVTGMVATQRSDKEISNLFIKTGRIQFIVLAFIFSGFMVFGIPFIQLWAGEEYGDAYYISLMFFAALLIPLIQNMGITILQARNQMKFRSLLYICIASVSLVAQILLSRLWGAMGCAVAISVALLIGQGLVMNIYYQRKQGINIVQFWREIGKMAVAPLLLSAIGFFVMSRFEIHSWGTLLLAMSFFTICYIPLFWKMSMSAYERELIGQPFRLLKKR